MPFPTPSPLPPKALIGMVHVRALPGSPAHEGESIESIAEAAAKEARTLADLGFDALIIENMHDRPYVHGDALGPEVVSAMTRVGLEVARAVDLPLGVQILSGGNRQAIAVAKTIGASFIRCENFVFAHVADEGLLAKAEAGELLRYRKSIGAGDVAIFADVKKKHASHAITGDVTLADCVHAAEFFGADGVIVTGAATGRPTDPTHVGQARAATELPVLVGSGVTPERVPILLEHADALIVGSALKRDGLWSNPLDPARGQAMVAAVRAAR
ncbi:MAG: BtpA/SgcQ family protein [Phycisphaerales bacterium]